MKKEIWKYIDGFGGKYLISSECRIKSLHQKNPRILKPGINSGGYPTVMLQINGRSKTISVHRLFAIAFIENKQNLKCINHIDGNKSNNHIDNLEWCTHSNNTIHAYKHNLNTRQIGVKNGRAKIENNDVIFIRELYRSGMFMQKELSVIFNIKQTAISRIILYKSWKHVE